MQVMVSSFVVKNEWREQAPALHLGIFRERGAAQTMGRVGACPHLISHQYTWRFFVGCGRGFGGFIFLCAGRMTGASPALHLGVFRVRGAAQTMGRVRACPHLISHQYAWRFFVGCGRGFGGFIFLCAGRTAGASPALHLGVFHVRGVVQTAGRAGACSRLISHQYTWRFLLVVGEGLVVLSFCMRDERRGQAPSCI